MNAIRTIVRIANVSTIAAAVILAVAFVYVRWFL